MNRPVRRWGAVVVGAVASVLVAVPVGAAEPPAATVSTASPHVDWIGELSGGTDVPMACEADEVDPQCDVLTLTVEPGDGWSLEVDVISTDDIDLWVYAEDGTVVAESLTPESEERVRVDDVAAGTYRVVTYGYYVDPNTPYAGAATLRPPAPSGDGGESVLWDHAADELQASVDAPLRVVAVGFEPGSLDDADLFREVPDVQRPGVLIPYDFAGESPDDGGVLGGFVNHSRSYYRETVPFLLPVEVRWQPSLIYAPPSFADALFADMVAGATLGRPHKPETAAYLEQYNATRGAFRGAPVAPGAEVLWVDAERTEDWLAVQTPARLGFAVSREPGTPGYTVFLLNTWDSAEAQRHFPADRYHSFLVERADPDTGAFDGIDWARIWGGRHRFVMVDLGAAPNPYESESWFNRNRSATGSAAYDPPLWEYRASAPRPVTAVHLEDGVEQAVTPGATWDEAQLHFMLARTINQAMSFRFWHSYLYEPRPGVGRFHLSDNIWHDAQAELPWASDLTKLFDQDVALAGLRSLLPYLEFEGSAAFEYLSDPQYAEDQAMLDSAKATGEPVPGASMSTSVAMDHLDAHPERFLRGGRCYTTVPSLQVVVPGHLAWGGLPLLTAGIATNRSGVPWGYLASVNDLTKTNTADRDETTHLVHPQYFAGAFTYTTVHEASHYLGLAHPHDTIGAVRGGDGAPLYYAGFAWTYNSTAAPTTYSHTELTYNVLDQENLARGHLAYYLAWTDEALHEGGVAFHDDGRTTVSSLPPQAALLRSKAIALTGEAERAFAGVDFLHAAVLAGDAWKAAAAYLDLAVGEPVGTAELARGTKKVEGDEATVCAKGGDVDARPSDSGDTLPATGGRTTAVTPLVVVLAGALVATRARRDVGRWRSRAAAR